MFLKSETEIEVVGLWNATAVGHWSQTNISAEHWESYTIEECDNDANWVIVRMPDDHEHNPNTHSKRVWTDLDQDGSFYYCEVAYGLETENMTRALEWPMDEVCDAEEHDSENGEKKYLCFRNSTSQLDDSNPGEGGCGNFSWTKYTPVPGSEKIEGSEGSEVFEKGLKFATKLFKSWKQNRATTSNRKTSKNSHQQSSMKKFKGSADPYRPIQAPYRPVQAPYSPIQAPYSPIQAPYRPMQAPYRPIQAPYRPSPGPYRPHVPMPCRGTRCGGRRQGPLKKLRRGKREEVTKESLRIPGNSQRKRLPNGWINGCHSISDCGLLRHVFSK